MGKLEGIIVDEISTEKSESEIIQKSINKNKEKYESHKTEHEDFPDTDNLVINEL